MKFGKKGQLNVPGEVMRRLGTFRRMTRALPALTLACATALLAALAALTVLALRRGRSRA